MPKRTLLAFLLFITAVTVAQNATPPVPTDLKAVLAPTMGPLPVVELSWNAPEGPWGYRVFRSDGDSLHFLPLALAKSRSYFDRITSGPNTYFYRVRSFTVTTDSQIVESAPSNTAWLTIGPPPPMPKGVIAGIVKDDTTGKPISGVFIQFYRMSPSTNVYFALPFAVTDSLGQYKAALDTGVYTIRAEPAPYMPPGPPAYIPEWYDNVREQSLATKVPLEEGKTFEANFGLSRKQIPVRPKGVIAGTVTDDGTQLPLPFAIVRFYYQGPHIMIYPPPTVFADSLGHYQAVLDTGMYLVRAEGPPVRTWYPMYQPEWYDNVLEISKATPVPVTPGSEFIADFGLSRIIPPKLVTIEGTVTNDVGNTDQPTVPIPGATVAIMRPIQAMNALSASGVMAENDGMEVDGLGYCRGIVWRGKTDSTGHYKATVLSGYSYIAVAARRGYLPEYYKEKVNPLQADLIKADESVANIDFTLAPIPALQNSISGKVRDSLDIGVAARIVLFPVRPAWPIMPAIRFGHTDSNGVYRLTQVREGKYFVLAIPFRGYAPAFYKEGAYGIRCWKNADTVRVSGDVSGIDIGVRPIVPWGALIIAGRVLDGAGLPLDGVRVFALSQEGDMLSFTVTDNAGTFSLEGLASEPMTVAFDREGFEPGQRDVTPAAGEFLVRTGDIILAATVTGTDVTLSIPAVYRLHPNYPNPFNPSTTITFDLPVASLARIVVYNILGQEIATLHNALAGAGTHTVTWSGKDNAGHIVAAGLYLVRFTALNTAGAEQFSQMRKMVMVK
jgi:hypothetical protein